ncbi:MAG TPA: hypothetical protein VGM54_12050 [Chthoniobacter sp.]
MNSTLRHYCTFLFVGLLGMAMLGCATMRPLSSKPPKPRIILPAPVSAHDGLAKVNLPAGEYHPLYEDARFFYYQAPSKLVVNGFFSKMFDGGVYVKRNGTALRGWYYVRDDGTQEFGRFESEPPHR